MKRKSCLNYIILKVIEHAAFSKKNNLNPVCIRKVLNEFIQSTSFDAKKYNKQPFRERI